MTNLALLMKDKNVTGRELATYMGVSEGNISDWKSGRVYPSKEKLVKLAEYFNTTTDYLLGNSDIKNQPTPDLQKKADFLMQLLIENGVVSENYTTDDLKRVADVFGANAAFIKQILNKDS